MILPTFSKLSNEPMLGRQTQLTGIYLCSDSPRAIIPMHESQRPHPCEPPLQIWRSDTAKCVYEQPGQAGSGLGGEATMLQLLPGGTGLVLATGDCRFVFTEPQVCSVY